MTEKLKKKVHWSLRPFVKSFENHTLIYVLDGKEKRKECRTYEEAVEWLNNVPFFKCL